MERSLGESNAYSVTVTNLAVYETFPPLPVNRFKELSPWLKSFPQLLKNG